jgi:hypothetical protein
MLIILLFIILILTLIAITIKPTNNFYEPYDVGGLGKGIYVYSKYPADFASTEINAPLELISTDSLLKNQKRKRRFDILSYLNKY